MQRRGRCEQIVPKDLVHRLPRPQPSRPRTPGTRKREEAAIAELGFVRNEAARHLGAGYSTTIGLMLLDAWNPSFIEIAQGVEERTAGHGWTILMSNSARDTGTEQTYLQQYVSRRVAGLIVIPNDQVGAPAHLKVPDDLPMVVVDRAEGNAGAMSVGRRRHDRRCSARSSPPEPGSSSDCVRRGADVATPVTARFKGFRRAVDAVDGTELEMIPAPLSIDAGLEVGRQLANRRPQQRPTAVATVVDLLAIGVLHSLLAKGLRVPDDLSLAGYDDIPFTSQLSVPLTTIARPHRQMGIAAADLLLSVLDGHDPTTPNQLMTPQLVVRESTAVL